MLATSTPQYSPLNSVSLYMASCSEEVRAQYYQKIGHDRPYDLSYVRFMLLGRQYKYFRDVVRDIDRSFQHYNSMYKQLGLPDVVPSARQYIYQIVHEMNFALFIRLPFNDQLFDEIETLTDEELGEPVRIINANEARLFQFLCQSFTEDQNQQLYQLMKTQLEREEYYDEGTGNNQIINLDLNMLYAAKARGFMRLVEQQIAT